MNAELFSPAELQQVGILVMSGVCLLLAVSLLIALVSGTSGKDAMEAKVELLRHRLWEGALLLDRLEKRVKELENGQPGVERDPLGLNDWKDRYER